MRFSNDNATWSEAETYGAAKSWTLTPGDGLKTVYAKFQDNTGNWSDPVSAAITLDTTAPVTTPSMTAGTFNGVQSITLSSNDGSPIFYTTDGSDPRTSPTRVQYSTPIGVTSSMTLKYYALDSAGNPEEVITQVYTITYTLSVAKDGTGTGTVGNNPAGIACGNDCSEAYESGSQVVLTPAADSGFTFTGWTGCNSVNGNDCTVEMNAARNVTASFNDLTPPVGTIAINGGAALTKTAGVTLGLTCADAGGCAQMRFSNDNATWSEAETYGAAKSWTLPAGDGLETVYAKFQDNAGNWSEPVSAAITLDTTAPVTTPSVTAGTFNGVQSITLSSNDGSPIFYTTDGSDPRTSPTRVQYSTPIGVTSSMTLKYYS
jgi:ribosomal protein L33